MKSTFLPCNLLTSTIAITPSSGWAYPLSFGSPSARTNSSAAHNLRPSSSYISTSKKNMYKKVNYNKKIKKDTGD